MGQTLQPSSVESHCVALHRFQLMRSLPPVNEIVQLGFQCWRRGITCMRVQCSW